MPRDLESEKSPPLTESPNSVGTDRSDSEASPSPSTERKAFVIVPEERQIKSNANNNLHPYTRPLTIQDLDSCVALEIAAFSDPNERATPEKFKYRLAKTGELCLGIFCTVVPDSGVDAETLSTGRPVETSRKNGAINVLLGHVIGIKTNDAVASDASMGVPQDWESQSPKKTNVGHQEEGRTIVLHSVAILPGFQGRGLGRVLMMCYMQNMNGAGIADRLALIAHDHKVSWYEKLGFTNKGPSKAQFGGGGWYDMVFELKHVEARATYG